MKSSSEYKVLGNSPITNWVFGLFATHNSGRDFRLSAKGVELKKGEDVMYNQVAYSYVNADLKAEFVIKHIKRNVPAHCQKMLIYVLLRGNEQGWKNNIATFTLDDFIEFKGEIPTATTRDVARRQFKEAMSVLYEQSLSLTVKSKRSSKKIDSFGKTRMISSYVCRTGNCSVEFPNQIIQAFSMYFQLFPTWCGSLKSQKSFALATYVFYRIKMAKTYNGKVKLQIKDLLCYMGMAYEKEQVANRRYKQLIITPFLKSISDLEMTSGETLTFDISSYNTIDEFLNGSVTVHYEKKIADYYRRISDN